MVKLSGVIHVISLMVQSMIGSQPDNVTQKYCTQSREEGESFLKNMAVSYQNHHL